MTRARTVSLAAVAVVAGVVAAATLGLVVQACCVTGVPFLPRGAGAVWIVYPSPADTALRPVVELDTAFRRRFVLDSVPPPAVLRLRAFRRCAVVVNGQPVDLRPHEAPWKAERRAEIAALLRPGENTIEVRVANDAGPPALWLRLEVAGQAIASDDAWEASWAGASWRHAMPAAAPPRGQRFDPEGRFPAPVDALLRRGPALIAGAAAWALLLAIGLGLRRHGPPWIARAWSSPWPLRAAFVGVAALWAGLFANNAAALPWPLGFDARAHVEYIQHVLEHAALPAATQGWQTYQPPLYYVLAAAALRLARLSPLDPGAAYVVRALGLVLGLVNLGAIAWSLRLVLPRQTRGPLLGLGLLACTPAILTLYQYPTNEGLAATLASLTLLITLRALRAGAPPAREAVVLGACLGLALLAKVSATLLLPAVLGALGWQALAGPREARRGTWARIVLVAGVTAVIAGWYYAGIWLRHGTPLVTNVATMPYWQDPGYRTLDDVLRFGRSLRAPMFAGLDGLWDGLYSTLWGDGLNSGSGQSWALPWTRDLLSAGYLLALVPTAAIVVGALASLVTLVRTPTPTTGLLVGTAGLVALGSLQWALAVPGYSAIKAAYGLAGLLPLAAFAATGLDVLERARRWLAVPLLIALGVWAVVSYTTYWIGDAPGTRADLGVLALARGQAERGVRLLGDAIARDPANVDARSALGLAMVEMGAPRDQVAQVLGSAPGTPSALHELARAALAAREGEIDDAIMAARRSVELDPDGLEGQELLARLLGSRGHARAAIDGWREVLRIAPHHARAHRALAALYGSLGMAELSLAHAAYAARLGP